MKQFSSDPPATHSLLSGTIQAAVLIALIVAGIVLGNFMEDLLG